MNMYDPSLRKKECCMPLTDYRPQTLAGLEPCSVLPAHVGRIRDRNARQQNMPMPVGGPVQRMVHLCRVDEFVWHFKHIPVAAGLVALAGIVASSSLFSMEP